MENKVFISGKIKDVKYSHTICNRDFYDFFVECERKSGTVDRIRCIAPENLIEDIKRSDKLVLCGKLKSHNSDRKLHIYVFVDSLIEYMYEDENDVVLEGVICKKPVIRNTVQSCRLIADFMIAFKRDKGGSDYIPCICWGSNAKKLEETPIGTYAKVAGRMQSREYIKKYEDGSKERNIAYELSVNEMIIG